jgi:hypothetical protein
MVNQSRSKSLVVKGAVIFAIAYVVKELCGYELDDRFIESCVIIAYAIYNIFAAYNNPRDKNRI